MDRELACTSMLLGNGGIGSEAVWAKGATKSTAST